MESALSIEFFGDLPEIDVRTGFKVQMIVTPKGQEIPFGLGAVMWKQIARFAYCCLEMHCFFSFDPRGLARDSSQRITRRGITAFESSTPLARSPQPFDLLSEFEVLFYF